MLGIILVLTVGGKKQKKSRWIKEWFKERHISLFNHEDVLKELKISEPGNGLIWIFFAWQFQLIMIYYKWLLPL
jgi:hypothetical protein